MDNIVMIISLQENLHQPITKEIVDRLGLSLLLFNIPGDEVQTYRSPQFQITAQRVDSLSF